MFYLTKVEDILNIIPQLASYKTLWVDTEIADWKTPLPKLSLIQVLANPQDKTGNSTYILDVLDKPDLVDKFVSQIMVNPDIEKVFHNAAFDLRYLGGRDKAENITCTLKMAREISLDILGTSDRKLKTLAVQLCKFTDVDTEQQASDWGTRRLTAKQLNYAKMDVVYLAAVHQHLLAMINPEETEKIEAKYQNKNISLNVTNVRVAFECPRLFYLNKHFGGKTLFLPRDRRQKIGTTFHQLAKEFITLAKQEPKFTSIFEPPAEELKVEEIASQMRNLFYNLVFFPNYLQPAITNNSAQATALLQIWEGITKLIRHWSEILINNRRYCDTGTVIASTFVAEESNLQYKFTLPNKTQQNITGRHDSLIYNFDRNRLCVVEFKTYDPVDPSAQLAQVALYSYTIAQNKSVPVDAAIYCVLPEFKEYKYSWEQLEDTVYQLIPYKLQQMKKWLNWEAPQPDPPPPTNKSHLCKICPQQEKCQSFFLVGNESSITSQNSKFTIQNEQPTSVPVISSKAISSHNTVETIDVDRLGKNLVQILQSYNIDVDYLSAIAAPAFIRVKLKPNLGVRVASILRLSDDLQVQLGISSSPLIATQPGYVSIDLPRQDRQIAPFESYIQRQKLPDDAPVKIALGVDLEGKLIEADLSDANTCHFLVGGTTGSGKSEFLRSILLSLIDRHTPQQIKIALVDPKRVTFPAFESMPWLLKPVVKDSDAAIELMEELVTEMERRYQLFEKAKCSDLTAYNKRQKAEPRIICIFDEYADFMVEKETRTCLEDSIKRLGAKARAAGIHLIIATQRPEARVVTPLIRSNLPGRVALKTASIGDSQIILGGRETAAAQLLGKGDLLYQMGAKLERLQALLATDFNI